MELPEPFYELRQHFAIDLDGARAVFSTRRGGHSEGPYASLNLGVHSGDDPEVVARNRQALIEAVGAPPLRFVHQVHGAEVLRVDRDDPAREPNPRADGQAADSGAWALTALTADCLPVAVAGGGAVAMLHAGWRGLAGGVIEQGVRALRELGGGGEGMSAAIGPGAGRCCYEAGPEVHAAFAAVPQASRGPNVDLKAVARHQLHRAGVQQIHDIGICTICSDPALLYSHRRDRGVTGRQAGVAWLT